MAILWFNKEKIFRGKFSKYCRISDDCIIIDNIELFTL